MEDQERFLSSLKRSDSIAAKLISTLEEDKQNIYRCLSDEAKAAYQNQCDKAIEEIKKIQRSIRILYSEANSGL